MAIFGDTLRQARAHKGVTLKEAEHATRINRHHLAALEDENFGALPPLIYQRGIIRNYATYLDLDPSKLLSMFEEARGAVVDPSGVAAAVKPLDMPSHWAPNFAIIAFMVVMSAVVFAWLYSAYFAASEVTPTVAEFVPTVTPADRDPLMVSDASPAASPETDVRSDDSPSPTPTPQATNTPAPTNTPRATNTPQPTNTPEPPPPTPTVEQAAVPEGPIYRLSFEATTGIYLSVVADGAVVYDGWMEAGQSTGIITATHYQVWTSDAFGLWITNHDSGAPPFNMAMQDFQLP